MLDIEIIIVLTTYFTNKQSIVSDQSMLDIEKVENIAVRVHEKTVFIKKQMTF